MKNKLIPAFIGLVAMSSVYTFSSAKAITSKADEVKVSSIENCGIDDSLHSIISGEETNKVTEVTEKQKIYTTQEYDLLEKKSEISTKLTELTMLTDAERNSYKDEISKAKNTDEVVSVYNKATETNETKRVAEEKRLAEEKAQAEAQAQQAQQTAQQQLSSGVNLSAREAFDLVAASKGVSAKEKAMWDYIVTQESGWNITATNPSSGAYGLPQSLPASKMATHGADYLTNPVTQLNWQYDYMINRYGSIAGAYGFKMANGWY